MYLSLIISLPPIAARTSDTGLHPVPRTCAGDAGLWFKVSVGSNAKSLRVGQERCVSGGWAINDLTERDGRSHGLQTRVTIIREPPSLRHRNGGPAVAACDS